ncbi:glycosyl hydrolase-like proteins family 32 superfamily [Lineolata rhizophorae]|uniref:Glycosyl hydrolase-like proteins family 32 superfamily n=1 Tax=Lineolata rhizophorae TaxID=578093 RepID=A0A6A6P6I8_9PEZI|nr:glycosyl hydrolase-like proteins family 32 superfamily [Lineolata rhizophorae]
MYAAVVGAIAPLAAAQAQLTADMIESMGNNSLFTRWRPISHFMAPAGWMNDPCGPMYDPMRDTYHLFYQWHPNHVNWGNISWGHATSNDLITWADVGGWQDDQAQALGTGPVGSYDGLGIFSGTAQPVNLHGETDGNLTIFYTSVSRLPTNYALPYLPGTESQSIATSSDGGLTWQKWEGNPFLDDPPDGWNITGWRDPFVEPWPAMDSLLAHDSPHYYAVYGSGIREAIGPRMPFYSAPARDLANWTFLGALWEPAANSSLGSVLATGSNGFNFEVSGFFSLPDPSGALHFFAQMGSEGGNVSFHPSGHWALWTEGIVTRRENGSVELTPASAGAGDWGNLYALTSFVDGRNGDRRVQWGWSPEDVAEEGFALTQMGYQGALALPRELFVHVAEGVANSDDGALTEKGNARAVPNADGTSFTAYTLGIKPLPDVVEGLRAGATAKEFDVGACASSSMLMQQGSDHMELVASFSRRSAGARVGFTVAASPDGEEYTNVYYEPANHTIVVDRAHSSTISQFANFSVVGYFYPYTLAETGEQEEINMTVFLDGSLLEVYANDRFALTTRIYPSREDSGGFGVFVDGEGASAEVSTVKAWLGTADVWPERPADSSSELVWDSAEETGNYTWWTGN